MSQIILEIQTNDDENLIERRFPSDMTMLDLKNRLELITGASASNMQLTFHDTSGNLINKKHEDDSNEKLSDYLVPGGELRLRLHVKDPSALKLDLNQSDIPKYEMNDEEYSKRNESLRQFKMKNKLGRFAQNSSGGDENSSSSDESMIKNIKIGDRCEVTIKNMPPRRGQVQYVGKLKDMDGYFVGIRYDEPWGKNDGTFKDIRYFECPPNYGSFVRPQNVKVGDYPELEENFED